MHDDGDRRPHPTTHVRNNGHARKLGIGSSRLVAQGGSAVSGDTLGQVGVHVLGKVAEEGVALFQGRRDVALGEDAQPALVVPELDAPALKMSITTPCN